ncbi:MAG: NAD(P)/FAD-dependent oxidoreductase [Alphaproteobacteria bacterium]|nr:NAD(P)/FAD-dependent oxidoreductase [Alphaproteobacteria bacterium]
MEEAAIETVVIGAGVVGLACARALAMAGREVIVLEAADAIGTETSSRNSEVIHAGIYYPAGSLKALTCVAGKHALYAYCDSHGVPYNNCGKLIVATEEDQAQGLQSIIEKAADNGVEDLEWLDGDQAAALEPALSCRAAALSPSTGIVDSHSLMLAYQGDAEDHGAMLAFNSPVLRGEARSDGIALQIGGDTPMTLLAKQVVNAAGLHAQTLAARIDGVPSQTIPPTFYCKGSYFTVSGKNPFARLIYPMPQDAGLGVHVTLDIGGQLRFGPDIEWVDSLDYEVDPGRADSFYAAIRAYWPGLQDGALAPGYAGIRPKIAKPGGKNLDFMVLGPEESGVEGLVQMFGIESPGLTASLALADHVRDLLAA